ncbi:MAG: hypothetical protein ACU85V_04550, partial [Gammaproteobacteria bacterium]
MAENASPAAALATLRSGVDPNDTSIEVQQRCEHWVGLDSWRLADEALPLLVGVDPAAWRAHVDAVGAASAEQVLLSALGEALDTPLDAAVAPARLRDLARSMGVELPVALSRLLDFVAQFTAPALPQADAA